MMIAPTETISGVSIFGISPLESLVWLSPFGKKMFVNEKNNDRTPNLCKLSLVIAQKMLFFNFI